MDREELNKNINKINCRIEDLRSESKEVINIFGSSWEGFYKQAINELIDLKNLLVLKLNKLESEEINYGK